MKYLIKNCKILHTGSPLHGKKTDILINKGKIVDIAKHIDDPKATLIKGKNLHVSIGWMDIGTHLGEPGYEHRETFESLAAAALSGGYTDLVTMPKSIPAIQTKAQIKSLIGAGKDHGINIHPLGALSQDLAGENITEFMDMHHAGAVGFTDGLKPVAKGGLLLRALEYAKSFDGTVIHHPNDESLAYEDLIHEGEVSIQLGMKGSPTLAEELITYRDVNLNTYAESKLCIHLISSRSAVAIIKNAKKKDENLTAGVSYLNLVKTHKDLENFDSNLKVKPLLRDNKDRKVLISALNDNTLDYIATNHVPLEVEKKHLEYPYASHGAIGLETAFAVLNTQLNNEVSLEVVIEKLTTGPRETIGINSPLIASGEMASLTIFDPSIKWKYNKADIKSTSHNSPFIGSEFIGKVVATFNAGTSYISNT